MDKERQIVNTNIRLNLRKEEDRKAWEYLCKMDRKLYKSYSRVVVIALNAYFDHMEELKKDPDLETKVKEQEFLQRVMDTVKKGVETKVAEKVLFLSAEENMLSIDERIGEALEKVIAEQMTAIIKNAVTIAVKEISLQMMQTALHGINENLSHVQSDMAKEA